MKKLKFLAITFLTFLAAFIITQEAMASAFIAGAALSVMSLVNLPEGVLGTYVGATNMSDGNVQVISQERDRAVYEHNKTSLRFKGKNITQGYLRLEAKIVQSGNILVFKTYDGDGNSVYATERRLDRNDAFIVDRFGLFLLKQDVANGKTTGRLHTYPNITEFGAAAAADLEALYNGELRITIGRVKKLVAYDTRRFLYVPQTQQSAATNRDNICGQKGGFAKVTPQIVLDGSGTNEVEIQFPTFSGWAGHSATAGTDHRAVLYFRGLHVTGGSQNE